jgi:formate hydrogenlyase subunit 3/multisubunit Na+/H+ antiporter MnhD subunit
MTLWGIGAALGILALGAVLSLLAGRSDRTALAIGSGAAVAGCAVGLLASLAALLLGRQEEVRLAWTVPVGALHVGLDPLASFFLVCVFAVSGLSALYGWSYLRPHVGHGRIAAAVSLFHLLVGSMTVLVLARDGVLFLAAWEGMSIASYFLVSFEDERESARRAGMTYLIASHAGAVFLFALFVLLSGPAGSFGFDRFAARGAPAGLAGLCFLLAVVGFGSKAGFWPLHVWLPDAHPAAPSHVSALMSGVMIKMGIYGLLRTLTFLGEPEGWWGVLLVLLGAVTGIAGVLHALGQRQLKRLLAYSSVENIGIIAIATGLGVLGRSQGDPTLSFLGYGAALLHTLNHGLFKGLLFQGAGAVLARAGTGDLDSLGGLARRMPATGLVFAIGSAALCGLPPLNGFVGEWAAYAGAFHGASALPGGWSVSALVAAAALALIGGLATACFARACGIAFLGHARSSGAERAVEPDRAMLVPMLAGATACVAIGLWPGGALRLVSPAASLLGGGSAPDGLPGSLASISRLGFVLAALFAGIVLVRFLLLRRRDVRAGATWGCGYEAPTARMQYTGASFSALLLGPFGAWLDLRVRRRGPEGYFPREASFEEHTGDPAGERLLVPATRQVVGVLSRLRAIQQGRVQLYLAYIFATLIALLLWRLGGRAGP